MTTHLAIYNRQRMRRAIRRDRYRRARGDDYVHDRPGHLACATCGRNEAARDTDRGGRCKRDYCARGRLRHVPCSD